MYVCMLTPVRFQDSCTSSTGTQQSCQKAALSLAAAGLRSAFGSYHVLMQDNPDDASSCAEPGGTTHRNRSSAGWSALAL